MKYAIAIDFDGTLCEKAEYPEIGKPRMKVIEEAKKRKSEGCALILYTCREGEYLYAALEWLKKYDLTFDAVNENLAERIEHFGNDCRKIGADEYWDDRSVNPEIFDRKQ